MNRRSDTDSNHLSQKEIARLKTSYWHRDWLGLTKLKTQVSHGASHPSPILLQAPVALRESKVLRPVVVRHIMLSRAIVVSNKVAHWCVDGWLNMHP